MSKIWYTKGWLIYQFVYARIPHQNTAYRVIVKLFLDIPSEMFFSWSEFQAIIDRDSGLKF